MARENMDESFLEENIDAFLHVGIAVEFVLARSPHA